MIPKKIHYCWYGGNPLNELAVKCLASWRAFCPEYEIIEWNEQNTDLASNRFMQEAYEAGKWAFVSDYMRLFALHQVGGIYMDADFELLAGLDPFLHHRAFTGFEMDRMVPTAIMGAVAGHPWIGELMAYYQDRPFRLPDGSYDTLVNPAILTPITERLYPVRWDDTYQELGDGALALYPRRYFCPKTPYTGALQLTADTVGIHHFSGTWHTPEEERNIQRRHYVYRHFGTTAGNLYACASNAVGLGKAGGMPAVWHKTKEKLSRKT